MSKDKKNDIVQLYDEFKEVGQYVNKIKELEKINTEQYKIIQKLGEELAIREHKLKHLEKLLMQTNPIVIEVSAEEEICELQIERLRNAAQTRDLTLEEARRLDIFIRNKRLAQDQSTINIEAKKAEITDAQLLQIAESKRDDEPSGNQS